MGTLYRVAVTDLHPTQVDLRVEPTQPDCCPFYLTERFAMGLLLDAPPGRRLTRNPVRRLQFVSTSWVGAALRNRRIWNREVYEAFRVDHHPLRDPLSERERDLGSAMHVDCGRYIASVRILETSTTRWTYGDPAPWALYRITTTAPRWLSHLTSDSEWDSVAYDSDDAAPRIDLHAP